MQKPTCLPLPRIASGARRPGARRPDQGATVSAATRLRRRGCRSTAKSKGSQSGSWPFLISHRLGMAQNDTRGFWCSFESFGHGSKLNHQGTEMAMAQEHGDQNGTQGYMEPETKTCGLPWLFNFEITIWVWVKTKAPGDRNGYGSKTWRPKWHPRVHGIKD